MRREACQRCGSVTDALSAKGRCAECEDALRRQSERQRRYLEKPEAQELARRLNREYKQRPEVKARARRQAGLRRQQPAYLAYQKAYRKRPEVREKLRERARRYRDRRKRPDWASPAMDMAAFREAKRWIQEGWRL